MNIHQIQRMKDMKLIFELRRQLDVVYVAQVMLTSLGA